MTAPRRVAFFGHHKCATQWIRRVMEEISAAAGLRFLLEHLPSTLPFGFETVEPFATHVAESRARATGDGWDFLCHINAERSLLDALDSPAFRAFHVIRDPRDILVSGYFSHRNSHFADPAVNPWVVRQRDHLVGARDVEEGLLAELDFAETYFRRLADWPYDHPRVREERFETLVEDPAEGFAGAIEFLGLSGERGGGPPVVPPGVLDAALERNTFTALSAGRRRGEEDATSHFRKGVAGDWRNHFTPRVTEAFDRRFGDVLRITGYA